MSISPARSAGFRILLRTQQDYAYACDLLHSDALNSLDEKDQRLATELVYGVLRQQRLLDWYLSRFCRMPLKKLDPEVLIALRLGAYQILFLTRVPVRAAINESVELVKASRLKSAAGLVNAILRRIKKDEFETALNTLHLDCITGLSIRYSHPEWLVQRWLERFGRETLIKLLKRNNEPPRTFLRLNTPDLSRPLLFERLTREGVLVRPHPFWENILEVVEGNVSKTSLFLQGKIFIQDAGSQLIPYLLNAGSGDYCLDLCAAPGGKTSQIAQLTQGQARIIGTDRDWHRLQVARQLHGEQWKNLWFVAADGTKPLPFGMKFDKILVDAPCSGTGTLQRNPEIRWRLKVTDLTELQQLQCSLLENASLYLRPDGVLVYSTCSLEEEENESIVSRFVAKHNEFFFSLATHPQLRPFFKEEKFFKLLPSQLNCDGFFAAVLRKGHLQSR